MFQSGRWNSSKGLRAAWHYDCMHGLRHRERKKEGEKERGRERERQRGRERRDRRAREGSEGHSSLAHGNENQTAPALSRRTLGIAALYCGTECFCVPFSFFSLSLKERGTAAHCCTTKKHFSVKDHFISAAHFPLRAFFYLFMGSLFNDNIYVI